MIIRLGAKERIAAQDMVDCAMHDSYGCASAYPLSECAFGAIRMGSLRGVISIEKDLRALFDRFRVHEIPAGFCVSRAVHIGRWVVQERGISRCLLRRAIGYGLREGFVWGISEMRPSVVRRLRRFGIRVFLFQGSFNVDAIPKSVLPYYDHPPFVGAVVLKDAETRLRIVRVDI